jgi:hypothetical protein
MANERKILEGRFIRKVLAETGKDIERLSIQTMSNRGFKSSDWYSSSSTEVKNTTLEYNHLAKSRFVNMKFRDSKSGRQRRKSHPIHNQIIWGQYNEVIKQLHFGFTDDVQNLMRTLAD